MAPGSAFLPRAGHAALVALAIGAAALVDAGCGHGVAASRPLTRAARTSGCVARRGLPDPGCTPGAVDARVNPTTLDTTICRRGYTRRVRPAERVTEAIKRERLAAYGEQRARLRNFELDHLVPLELGGAPAAVANLWPESLDGPRGARVKDRLEDALNHAVCRHRLDLAKAQAAIAADWESAYRRFVITRWRRLPRGAARRSARLG